MHSANAYVDAICILIAIVIVAAWFLGAKSRKRLNKEMQAELVRRIKEIEALTVPAAVLQRAAQLLREKDVVLDERQQRYMIEGFKDYLIAVLYSHVGPLPRWRQGVAMTSDTVDMLWHAWLEDPEYEETFTRVLGFPLVHLPEPPERVASQRGPGNIDFLKTRPHRKAVATYQTLKQALPLAERKAHASGLYLLDKMVKNRDGFYYSAAIFAAFEHADLFAAPVIQHSVYYPGSNCQDGVLRKKAAPGSSCGASNWDSGSVNEGGGHGQGGHGSHGSHSDGGGHGSSCSSGHGCGSSCGSGCGGGH